jgi:hypothetical protein
MAPTHDADDAHTEEPTAKTAPTNEPRFRTRAKPKSSYGGAGESSLIQLCGWAALLTGAAASVGAQYVSPLGGLAGALDSLGLSGSLLGVCGVALIAVGRVRRGQVDLARRADDARDMELLYEQLSNEFLGLRGAVEEVQRDNGATRGAVQKVHGEVSTVQQMLADAAAQPDGAQDALFRLAASLDKMSARVEQRMNTQFESFQGGLTAVRDDIVQAQSNLAVVLADLPKMVAAQGELKKTMGELPKLAANLEALRSQLPSAIRGYVAENVDTARAELESGLGKRIDQGLAAARTTLDQGLSAARTTLDKGLRGELESRSTRLSEQVQSDLRSAAVDLRSQIERDVDSALQSAREQLAAKLGVDLQAQFQSARDELAKGLRKDLESQTKTVRGDLTGMIDKRLEQDLARASQSLTDTLGRELGMNLQRSHAEFSDSLILRLQEDFERARDDMDSTLTKHVHGDFEELRSDLVGKIEEQLSGTARQTREELGGKLEGSLADNLARARADLAQDLTQRFQGDFDAARADLSGMLEARLQGDLGGTREELSAMLQSRLAQDLETLRRELSQSMAERVASDLAAAREDLGAMLRGEVQGAIADLPALIRSQIDANVGHLADDHDAVLGDPVVAEQVKHVLDETYDAAYKDTPAALPQPAPAATPVITPHKLDTWNAEQTRFYNPKTPAERAAELEAKDKLEQINSLLHDEHLRSALEDLDGEK